MLRFGGKDDKNEIDVGLSVKIRKDSAPSQGVSLVRMSQQSHIERGNAEMITDVDQETTTLDPRDHSFASH